MTDKEIFKEIWSIKDPEIRVERLRQLESRHADVAARIKPLLQYSGQFQSILDDPLILLKSPAEDQPTNRYAITSELAKGGMGVVYTAYDSQMRRETVLKCLQPKHRDNFRAVQRFYNEAHITGQLQHPGIAPVYELGELDDGRPYYCMKLVKGKTLAQFLADRDSNSSDQTRSLNFFLQICQTMAFAHERGILHRDLKPSNIIVGDHGQTQIMDWGVAKSLAATDEFFSFVASKPAHVDMTSALESADTKNTNPDLTHHGQIIGTPGYMSPEQAMGQNDLIGKRSDVYSLGAILCEILTGSAPVGTEARSMDEFASSLGGCNQRLQDSNADVEMVDLARSCLQQKPENRPPDADAVAKIMLAYFETRDASARATQIKLEKELTLTEETHKRRLMFASCVAACLGILVAGIVGTSIGFYKENAARTLADEKAEDARIANDLAIAARTAADDSKTEAENRLEQLKKGNAILESLFDNLHLSRSLPTGQPLIDLLAENLDKATLQLEGDPIGAPDVVASFQLTIGKCYHELGFEKKAIPLLVKAHDFAMAEHGIENEMTLEAQSRLADALLSNHETERALPLLLQLQEFYTRDKKTDTSRFLKIQIRLASIYIANHQYKNALNLLEPLRQLSRDVWYRVWNSTAKQGIHSSRQSRRFGTPARLR